MKKTITKTLIAATLVTINNLTVLATQDQKVIKELSKDIEESQTIGIGGGLTSIYQRNVRGGLSSDSRKGEFSGSYDIEILIDTDKIFGIDGQFFIHGEGGWTDSEGIDSESVGSFFGTNADAGGNRTLDIVEAFYQTEINDQFDISVGKIDFTGFFDASEYANDETMQFLNGSLVNNSAIPFPDYSLGTIATFSLDSCYLMAGVADAEADGRETGFNTAFDGDKYFFYIAEAGLSTAINSQNGELGGNYRIGVWNDPQPKANSDISNESRDDTGFYASFDQMVAKENDNPQDDQGLGVFFRYGYADLKRNDMSSFCSVGCQYKGIFEGRDNDVFGVGYSNGSFSNYAETTYPDGYESAFEAYYNIEITPDLSLCPDLQYITNPGGTNPDAVVLAMRVQYSF